jgi:hypothetical protein
MIGAAAGSLAIFAVIRRASSRCDPMAATASPFQRYRVLKIDAERWQ